MSRMSNDLDVFDAAILDCIKGMCTSISNKIEIKRIRSDDHTLWTWIDLQHLINEMPLLRINSRGAITRRIKKIEKNGFISTRSKSVDGHIRLFVKLERKIDELTFFKDNVTSHDTLIENNEHVDGGERDPQNHVDETAPIIYTNNTNNNITKSSDSEKKPSIKVDIFKMAPPTRTGPSQAEIQSAIDSFSLVNVDYRSFHNSIKERNAVKKLIVYAASDGLEVSALVRMAKELHGVEYAPQVFSPTDMVMKYSKVIAYRSRGSPKPDFATGTPYTKGKYVGTQNEKI